MLRLSQWVGKPVKNGTGIGPATVHFSNVVKGRMFHARKTGYKYILAYPTLFENYRIPSIIIRTRLVFAFD